MSAHLYTDKNAHFLKMRIFIQINMPLYIQKSASERRKTIFDAKIQLKKLHQYAPDYFFYLRIR